MTHARKYRFYLITIVSFLLGTRSLCFGLEETVYVRSFDGAYVAGYLRVPEGPGPHPVVMVVHGGKGGIKLSALKQAGNSYVPNHLFADGYAVFQVDYRRYHFGQEELEDVVACFRYLKERPEIDPNRIGVVGGSHGAILSLLLATRLTPAAVVAFSARTDIHGTLYNQVQKLLPTLRDDPDWQERRLHNGLTIPEELALLEAGNPDVKLPSFPTEKEMGLDMAFQWGSDEESYHRYSPITRFREIHCPILYLVGSEDRNAPGGKLLVDKLQELGRTAEYSLHPNMPHAFYWGIRPDKDGNLPSEFYRALKVTTDFLRKHVKNAGKTGE